MKQWIIINLKKKLGAKIAKKITPSAKMNQNKPTRKNLMQKNYILSKSIFK
jgi:hypothetical protein